MSNWRFEMYEYLLIIIQLKQGATLRGLAREQVADKKKLRKIRDVALARDWLELEQYKPLPIEEELSLVFKSTLPLA